MRVATYNIRNVRAVDWSSLWWRRRRRLASVIEGLACDLLGLQEVYPSQRSYLAERALPSAVFGQAGRGRNRDGGGEGVPLYHRRATLQLAGEQTRWFGAAPDEPGSKMADASHPRIATIARYTTRGGAGDDLTVVNLHLDHASDQRRAASLKQLAEWIEPDASRGPLVVLGDFNGTLDEPGFTALFDLGLVSAVPLGGGATANGFGRGGDAEQQIDHVFVNDGIEVDGWEILASVGYASDHYPIVVDLSLR